MKYEPKDYHRLLGTEGFSDRLRGDHFFLYRGYVNRTNKLEATVRAFINEKRTETIEFEEVRRRFAWEFNGMRLHEYYFGSMVEGGIPLETDTDLFKKMAEDFGSYRHWEEDFKRMASMPGIGWVIQYLEPFGDRLFNAWITGHDQGHLAGAVPILVLDVFEHAFILDYGVKKINTLRPSFKPSIGQPVVIGL